MNYLLDTCVISELVKRKPNLQFKSWFNQQEQSQLFLSAITLAEIKKGIYKIKPTQPDRAVKLQRWLNTIEISFSQRILPITDEVLEQWARLSALAENEGNTIAVMDGLIGATAYYYDSVLVTRNVDDFKKLPVKIINPFTSD